jgi:hypothetical protein
MAALAAQFDRLSRLEKLRAGLLSPWVFLLLLPWAAFMVVYFAVGSGATLWVLIPWGLVTSLLVGALGLLAPATDFKPRTIATSEVSRLGPLVRGGFAIYLAAVIGAAGSVAVTLDFGNTRSGLNQVFGLLGIVSVAILIVATCRLILGIAFRWQLLPRTVRHASATRLVLRTAGVVAGRPGLRSALRSPTVSAWAHDLCDRIAMWLSALIASASVSWVLVWAAINLPGWYQTIAG